jgi:NADH:ubiquinone oxidoreductase subunit 4 (subunit M)
MFPFYLWLTKAHVEAPTAGSVLLAGILLKLGSYGILRFLFLFPQGCKFLTPLILSISLLGLFNSLLATIRQIDLKRLIAYSSISHLNFANLGIFSGNNYGLLGSYSMIIFHGIVSSALFLAIGLLYDRYKTRNIFYYRSLANVMPIFSFFLFLFFLANLGFPGTANFVSEILIFLGVCQSNLLAAFLSLSSILLSGIIGFWTISRILFGNYYYFRQKWFIGIHGITPIENGIADLNRRELFILGPFLILIVVFGLMPSILLSPLEFNLYQLNLGLHRNFLNHIDFGEESPILPLLWKFAMEDFTL